MTKSDLIAVVADKTGTSKAKAKEIIETTFAAIKQSDKVTIIGFGRFERKKRTCFCNPKAKERTKKEVEKLVFKSKVTY